MAAFYHPFLFDSVFSTFSQEPITNTSPYFYQNYQLDNHLQNISPDVSNVYESSCPGNSNTQGALSNTTETHNKQSTDSSSPSVVVDRLESSDQITHNSIPIEKKRKYKDGSSTSHNNSAQSKDKREMKGKKQKKNKDEEKIKKKEAAAAAAAAEAPSGYIHVRARRGQATDSHSLAERVRREKISERMKLLQSLVPGCDKVTGKALMLDEIINYVQSLQNQVEFLSMKLGCVNPMLYDFGLDLDSFMVRPERLSSLESAAGANSNSTTANNTNNNYYYPHLDTSTSFLLQQAHIPNIILSQGNGQLLWDVDAQSQRNIISQSPHDQLSNLCSFHI